jgi:hypothetical protein
LAEALVIVVKFENDWLILKNDSMTMRDCAWLWMLDAGSGHAELRMKLLFTQPFVLL